MRYINPLSHIGHLQSRLSNLIPAESFAFRFRRAIGEILNSILEDAEEYQNDSDFFGPFPVRNLVDWLHAGKFDAEWLTDNENRYFDDEGVEVTVVPVFRHWEILACYGLWLITDDLSYCENYEDHEYDDKGFNPDGWSKYDILNHKAECMLSAYQALSYATHLKSKQIIKLEEEKSNIPQVDFSKLGSSGAKKRWENMGLLREWVIDEYRNGTWQSANQAAHALRDRTMEKGRTFGAVLTSENAQRTIAEWIRKASK